MQRASFPATFDADVDRAINDAFLVAPALLDHVNVINDLDGKDDYKVDADSTLMAMPEKLEDQPIALDSMKQRYTLAMLYKLFALGFEASYEMVQDDKRGKIMRLAASLGQSAQDTLNTQAANLINNGFSTTWGDGVALFATTHPTAGGTASNTPATQADLTPTTLNAALVALMNTVDHRGKRMPIRGVRLLLPPALDKLGVELSKSANAIQTTDNEINYFAQRVLYDGANPYFTDSNGWAVQALQGHGLSLIMRELFNSGMYDKNDNLGRVHYAKLRAVAAVEFWRGTYGSSGTA